jgi:hypothetical protein
MTVETISSSFRATGLVLFNPERVLENLGPIIEATPLLRSIECHGQDVTASDVCLRHVD